MTPLHIVSLVLDGMPFLQMQYDNITKYPGPWTWHICEGAADNKGSTSWCKPQQPRFSRDGSTELINSWLKHPNIHVYRRQLWTGGKDEQFNEALKNITENAVLLQADVDEIWTPDQLVGIVRLFDSRPEINSARFYCRYYVGPDIIITSTHSYGNRPGEWHRAFRFRPGMKLLTHEPPRFAVTDPCATRDETKALGLVFEHYSWMFERQVATKAAFYGYPHALDGWRRLQLNRQWPVRDLRLWLPWVDRGVTADRIV